MDLTARQRAIQCLQTLYWCADRRLLAGKRDFLYHRIRCDDVGTRHAIADIRQADEEKRMRKLKLEELQTTECPTFEPCTDGALEFGGFWALDGEGAIIRGGSKNPGNAVTETDLKKILAAMEYV